MPLSLAADVAGMLVRMGRAVPANQWVEALVEREKAEARAKNDAALPHNNMVPKGTR